MNFSYSGEPSCSTRGVGEGFFKIGSTTRTKGHRGTLSLITICFCGYQGLLRIVDERSAPIDPAPGDRPGIAWLIVSALPSLSGNSFYCILDGACCPAVFLNGTPRGRAKRCGTLLGRAEPTFSLFH